jgi:hypothetical protein
MHPISQAASEPLPAPRKDALRSRPAEDMVYQAMTVAAILLVLGSLWVF